MKKLMTFALFSAVVLLTTSAFAAGVANTSKKGSVLKWPLITIFSDADGAQDTIIHISNDNTVGVQVKCYYMNEKKGRRDFSFFLTKKQTATWSVFNHSGTIDVATFPTDGTFPGRTTVGELVCFATDEANSAQIRFNHLSGIATVVETADTDATQPHQAFEYNAWAFQSRVDIAEGAPVGTAGAILLNGVDYDACPAYLITEFSPGGSTLAARVPVTTIDNDLAVASCKEDLRQDFLIHLTKLQFTVWNAFETKFTGAYTCSDTVREFGLDVDAPSDLVASASFKYSTLLTTDARFQVQGVKSTQCPGSESTGLIGVLHSSVAIAPDAAESTEIGTTLRGAGTDTTGYILWDPEPSGPTPEKAAIGR